MWILFCKIQFLTDWPSLNLFEIAINFWNWESSTCMYFGTLSLKYVLRSRKRRNKELKIKFLTHCLGLNKFWNGVEFCISLSNMCTIIYTWSICPLLLRLYPQSSFASPPFFSHLALTFPIFCHSLSCLYIPFITTQTYGGGGRTLQI